MTDRNECLEKSKDISQEEGKSNVKKENKQSESYSQHPDQWTDDSLGDTTKKPNIGNKHIPTYPLLFHYPPHTSIVVRRTEPSNDS